MTIVNDTQAPYSAGNGMKLTPEQRARMDWLMLRLIEGRGPMQAYDIQLAFREVPFRAVDAAIRRLKKRGAIRMLPRVRKVRPFPLWEIVP